ncbi:MAG TPA: PAS domain S-box protein [Jatrophihabitantaceae bacterium]
MSNWWRRVYRDPYSVLLAAAAAVQGTLGASPSMIARPGWVVVALCLYVATCALAVVGRIKGFARVQMIAPFALLAVAAAWRAADRQAVNGFGALALIAVVWLGFYGTRTQVWCSVVGVAVAMIVPSVAVNGGALGGDDLRRSLLTIAIAAVVGPSLHSLVSQRRRAADRAEALEPKGSELEAMMRAASGHLIIRCTPDGTVVGFNAGAEKILGWRADEVVGAKTLLDFHDPVETAQLAERLGVEPTVDEMLATALNRDAQVRDYRCRTKSGRRIVVGLSVSGITNSTGDLVGYVGIGTDVTQARQAMQSLAAQREIYRVLVDNLPSTTVGLWDEQLRCVAIGGHWLAKIGGNQSDYVDRPIEQFFHERDREHGRATFERARREPVLVEMDLADDRSYEFSALPVAGPEGENLVLSLSRDITARRAAERERQQMIAALAVSEASFREAFEAAPIGIALTTVEEATERFQRVNPAFAAILGRRPDDLIGRPVKDVTHPEDAHLQPDLTQGSSAKLRKRFVRPSGHAVWVEVSYTIVRDADGTPSHIIKQIQDIDAIKESERALLDALEQQRAATTSLRELDRIRTDLVGTISHELRTPLTSVQGYLELLESEQLTEHQHNMLRVALRNADRLSALVDNLLVLVRLDSAEGLTTFSSTDVVVSRIVAGAADTVRPGVAERSQSLDIDVIDSACVVRGDAEQLDRVLVNLLSNASKYTPDGGRIGVRVDSDDGEVVVSVTDTGIGIPADEQTHLFTRFFRASTAREHSIGGNGLGLAIVKSIVERHDGSVSVRSTPGAGSQFTVRLPLVRHAAVVG